MSNKKAKVIALYLPQFQPILENDKFWGKGFTEWTNVAKSKPLFKGHYQPRIPADLGFYDLRLPEVSEAQAQLAKEHGIYGFCYWHYWFGDGKEVLEKTFDRVVESGKPDFPFCLGWANHDWTTKTWNKDGSRKDEYIFKQVYAGREENISHFNRLLKAFKDERYIRVDGKLLFLIFDPLAIPNIEDFFNEWNNLAKDNDLVGFHFVALNASLPNLKMKDLKNIDFLMRKRVDNLLDLGFEGIYNRNNKLAELKSKGFLRKGFHSFIRKYSKLKLVDKFKYSKIMKYYYTEIDKKTYCYPEILVGWDRSPRAGKNAIIYYDNNPKEFKKAVNMALDCVKNREEEKKIIFLNSWNEWGEGAYIEPDLRYGKKYLEVLKEILLDGEKSCDI